MIYTHKNTVSVGKPATAFLNSLEIKDVVEACPKQGYLVRHLRDKDGLIKLAPGGKEIASEKIYGDVEVRFVGEN